MALFTSCRVLVVGDLILDQYWEGLTERISPEAPVPVVHIEREIYQAGGAANVAVNVAKLGAKVVLMGLVGSDEAAQILTRKLREYEGIFCCFFAQDNVQTIKKLRVTSREQQLIRLDFEESLSNIDKGVLLNAFKEQVQDVDIVVISDYAKGTLSNVDELIEVARQANKIVLVDPKGLNFHKYRGADLLSPNMSEFEAVVGRCDTEDDIVNRGRVLMEEIGVESILITRGPDGVTLLQKNESPYHRKAITKEVFDVTGAGDTLVSVMGVALSADVPIQEAVELANTAAGIVVGNHGAGSVTEVELFDAFRSAVDVTLGWLSESKLLDEVTRAKYRGESIVMTNGCFDILHAGHIECLRRAKEFGDRLIVAINSDKSVASLKGEERPINELENRIRVIEALKYVDWIVSFETTTPLYLYQTLLPDVLVKGGDYSPEEIEGGAEVIANGGRVEIVELVPGLATTSILDAIVKG